MPSWNIHIAHVEDLLSGVSVQDLGIADPNIFLFGNLLPDVYVGYMVPNTTMRIDYRITHVTFGNLIPTPHADRFWDDYLSGSHLPKEPAALSLTLGAWAHLVTDRFYNGHFRAFWSAHDMPTGKVLRERKQADFDLFGRSLSISSQLEPTPTLIEACDAFEQYRLLEADVRRAVEVANAIVRDNAAVPPQCDHYQLLSAEWMHGVMGMCNERLAVWLQAWRSLCAKGAETDAASIRAEAGLPPVTPDNPNWMQP